MNGAMGLAAESSLSSYAPAGVYFFLVFGTGLFLLNLSRFLGPRRPHSGKSTTYECGVPLLGSSRVQFSVKFYVVAILFVLFDIETIFLIPWAVVFRDFGVLAVVEMLVFISVLGLGLLYVWRRGGLEWD